MELTLAREQNLRRDKISILKAAATLDELTFTILDQSLMLADVQGDVESLTGHPADVWVEPGFLSLRVLPDDLGLVSDFVGRAAVGEAGQSVQCRLRRADRSVIWVRMTVMGATQAGEDVRLQIQLNQVLSDPSSAQELAAVLSLKEDVLDLVINKLNHSTRAISGYAGMLERHLSIQEDTIGSEYALGMRNGLEELHTLLHHLRPVSVRRGDGLVETRDTVAKLKAAVQQDD